MKTICVQVNCCTLFIFSNFCISFGGTYSGGYLLGFLNISVDQIRLHRQILFNNLPLSLCKRAPDLFYSIFLFIQKTFNEDKTFGISEKKRTMVYFGGVLCWYLFDSNIINNKSELVWFCKFFALFLNVVIYSIRRRLILSHSHMLDSALLCCMCAHEMERESVKCYCSTNIGITW